MTSVPRVSDRICFQILKLHESPFENCPCAFSTRAGFSPFFDSWWLNPFPQHRSEPWSFDFSSSDQFEVLHLLSSILNNSAVSGSFLIVQITELDPILCRNLERHRSVSVHWIHLRDLVQLHESTSGPKKIHRSCKQSAFLVRVCRLSEHVPLRDLPSFGKAHSWYAYSLKTQFSHQASRSHLAISTSVIHCMVIWGSTYFSLEVDFPALKFQWV